MIISITTLPMVQSAPLDTQRHTLSFYLRNRYNLCGGISVLQKQVPPLRTRNI